MSDANSTFFAIQSGATLVASGTVIPMDQSPLDLGIPISDGKQLTLQLTFRKDTEDTKSRWQVTVVPDDPLKLVFEMVNLDSPLGGGPGQPVPLWKSGTSRIYLTLRIFTQGDASSVIHFSFFRREEGEKK